MNALLPRFETATPVPVRSILKSKQFRQAYHEALQAADQTVPAQRLAARKVIENYFSLKESASITPRKSDSFYFAEVPVKVAGTYKFLVPGTIKQELRIGPLLLLTPKSTSAERLLQPEEFDRAVRAVEAVRLTLIPERVNGIISFISDAKKFYMNGDAAGSERAIRTAQDHFSRAAAEGLRRINSDAEKGRRSNEIAGTRRIFADLRKKLQAERARPTQLN
jgi:hypothetical protein